MADPALERVPNQPFTAFNFAVEIDAPDVPGTSGVLCAGAFSECDGMEMTMDVKTIREGGNNTQQVRLTGPVNFGTLTLKRGMTKNFDLWRWFAALYEANPASSRSGQAPPPGGLRATTTVVILAEDRQTERARFLLTGCLPVKLKAPPLNAKDGMVAVEELQIAYESMQFVLPTASAANA